MRSFVLAAALSVMLAAAPIYAQTGQPAGAGQSQPAPSQSTATQPPRPFPEGSKIAVLNIQRVASQSAEGKVSTAKVQALHQQKSTQLADMNKKLQGDQQKLQSQQSVMNDQARGQLERDIDRQQKEIQRFQQDAQEEVQQLQGDLQQQFERKLQPVIEQVVQERGIQVLFSRVDAGIVWADTGLDVTEEVIKRLDAASPAPASTAAPTTTTPPASAPPAKPATTPPAKPQTK
jgi:outer membrane protein